MCVGELACPNFGTCRNRNRTFAVAVCGVKELGVEEEVVGKPPINLRGKEEGREEVQTMFRQQVSF